MDLRVENIFREAMHGDKSFEEKESPLSIIFGSTKYTKLDMRETWDSGIKHGIEIGLRKASLEGQQLELYHNIQNEKDKEFVDKFYKLAAEYNCAIQYHYDMGMVIISKDIDYE